MFIVLEAIHKLLSTVPLACSAVFEWCFCFNVQYSVVMLHT